MAQNGARQPGGQPAGRNAVNEWVRGQEGNPGGGAGGGQVGPMTGNEYVRWSDRLRDLEEVLQDPELRNDVAQVRERARQMRADYTRKGENPKWDLVDAQIIAPLRVLQDRVAEELARLGSREAVVPVDRDPVPQQYSELVNRYYERLGR